MWNKYKPYVIVCASSSHSVKQFLQFSLMSEQFFAVITCQFYDKNIKFNLKKTIVIFLFLQQEFKQKSVTFLSLNSCSR